MSIAEWSLLVGCLLITMALVGSLLGRLPMSAAMIYLGVGYLLGPGGFALIAPDPIRHAGMLAVMAEAALLISLFAVGLKLGVPMFDRRWILPMRLAFPSMIVTIGLIALVGVWGLGLSLGEAILLGGILAPTDPVLAAGVQSEGGDSPDLVGFSLSGEGALNDGSAFPFVLLGLGLMGLHPLGAGAWHWCAVDLVWATVGGLAIGAIFGKLLGMLVVYLRTRHHYALGLDEFLALGLVAISYGAAQLCLASGFLAVFAAGLALQRVKEQPMQGARSLDLAQGDHPMDREPRATHSHHASATMSRAVQIFNQQLEKLAELAIVLVIGAMLPYTTATVSLLWFIPLFLVVIRPFAAWVGAIGKPMTLDQRIMIGWFGIRGIGSVFYLMYALHHGVSGPVADQLVTLSLLTVAASIIAHGVTVTPFMNWYVRKPQSVR